MKKYICQGGDIIAKDGNVHYISAKKLPQLYKINPDECIFIEKNEKVFLCRGSGKNSMVILLPKSDGNYNLINK